MNIRPVITPEHIASIATAARANGHACIAPTHFLESTSGEIRGFASIGMMTPILFWSHTENEPVTSLRFAKKVITLARSLEKPVVCLCTDDSPFARLMPEMDFLKLGHANLWQLKGGQRA